MAWYRVSTGLPPEDYARIMAITGWFFNQVTHPQRVKRGCDGVWLQAGYDSEPNRIAGRDDVARAIAVAESKIANFLKYWPFRKYFCGEKIRWPTPKRGYQISFPILTTKWGYFVEGGREAYSLVEEGVAVQYFDEDGDGVTETAYIVVEDVAVDPCELVVLPHGKTQDCNRDWRIRPLEMCSYLDDNDIIFSGPKWLFVNPDVYLNTQSVSLDSANFLTTVDIYRHYTNPENQAQIVWKQGVCNTSAVCEDICQAGCITEWDDRLGQIIVRPAAYNAGSWTWRQMQYNTIPHSAKVWYRAGYDGMPCETCADMNDEIKEAIVRLANVFLPEAPCGCDFTRESWKRDREELAVDSTGVEMVQAAFGTTARGAIFAYNTFSNLPPIGQGG